MLLLCNSQNLKMYRYKHYNWIVYFIWAKFIFYKITCAVIWTGNHNVSLSHWIFILWLLFFRYLQHISHPCVVIHLNRLCKISVCGAEIDINLPQVPWLGETNTKKQRIKKDEVQWVIVPQTTFWQIRCIGTCSTAEPMKYPHLFGPVEMGDKVACCGYFLLSK